MDLFRYAAWLAGLRHYPDPEKPPADYEEMKEAARARNAALSALGRDIGPIPEVVDPEDVEMLQDLILAAVNDALARSQEMVSGEMSKLTGGMNIPGLM